MKHHYSVAWSVVHCNIVTVSYSQKGPTNSFILKMIFHSTLADTFCEYQFRTLGPTSIGVRAVDKVRFANDTKGLFNINLPIIEYFSNVFSKDRQRPFKFFQR